MYAGQTKQQFSKSSLFKRFNWLKLYERLVRVDVCEYKGACEDKENLVQYFVFEISQKRLHFGHFSK